VRARTSASQSVQCMHARTHTHARTHQQSHSLWILARERVVKRRGDGGKDHAEQKHLRRVEEDAAPRLHGKRICDVVSLSHAQRQQMHTGTHRQCCAACGTGSRTQRTQSGTRAPDRAQRSICKRVSTHSHAHTHTQVTPTETDQPTNHTLNRMPTIVTSTHRDATYSTINAEKTPASSP
jgi:hypothetical protein